MNSQQVLFERKGALAVVTLNRPKALNTLSVSMLELLREQYPKLAEDVSVSAVVIKANGGKAFCAGGDVKFTVQEMREGRHHVAKGFFRIEYGLNHFLGLMTKPNIAIIDGIIMGGGAGISLHGAFRVATERTLFAMPECAIGLVPDVGASFFLNKCPGHLGTYLGLTGTRLKGFQIVEAGLATHLISSDRLKQLEEKLVDLNEQASDPAGIEKILSSFQASSHEHTQASGLLDILPDINECFANDSVESIIEALEARDAQWAKDALKKLSADSPLSQKLTLQELREGAGKSLASCLKMEFRLVSHIVDGPSDFDEGIGALLIRKDGNPKWTHSSPREVPEDLVNSFFAPVNQELALPFLKQTQSKI